MATANATFGVVGGLYTAMQPVLLVALTLAWVALLWLVILVGHRGRGR